MPYALTACLTLLACMRWAAAKCPLALARQAQMARALEVAEADTPDEVASHLLAERVHSFIKDLGLPTRLGDVGMSNDDLARLVRPVRKPGRIGGEKRIGG